MLFQSHNRYYGMLAVCQALLLLKLTLGVKSFWSTFLAMATTRRQQCTVPWVVTYKCLQCTQTLHATRLLIDNDGSVIQSLSKT